MCIGEVLEARTSTLAVVRVHDVRCVRLGVGFNSYVAMQLLLEAILQLIIVSTHQYTCSLPRVEIFELMEAIFQLILL